MNFRELPGFPPFFLDWVEGVSRATSFLSGRPDLETAATRAAELQKRHKSSPTALESALVFPNPGTAVVLAHARAAVAGGPLSVLLKCLTACRVAAALSSRGTLALPVCCVDSRSPGLAETESAWVLDFDARMREIFAADAGALSGDGFVEIIEQTAPGRQSTESLEFLRTNYGGQTLSSASCRFLSALAREFGLMVIDAEEPRFESVVAEKLKSVAADHPTVADVSTRREELRRAGYNLPDHESETAVLKAASQGLLLPVAVQVCDPAELGFRALIEPLFSRAGLPAPVAWPRASMTLLDPRSRKFLSRHRLGLNDLFADRDELLRRVLNEPARESALERFDVLETSIPERLAGFLELVQPDDYLREAVEASRGKMLYQVGKLKERFQMSAEARREAEQRQLERARNTLAPSGQLQENILSSIHFLLRNTPALVRFLYENLEFTKLEHQTLSVD